jgi:hypothetical protein
MAKKKKEHITFDQTLKTKKSFPINQVNNKVIRKSNTRGR